MAKHLKLIHEALRRRQHAIAHLHLKVLVKLLYYFLRKLLDVTRRQQYSLPGGCDLGPRPIDLFHLCYVEAIKAIQ